MLPEVARPPFFELSASEADYLIDINFHLNFWERESTSELIRLRRNSDWKSSEAQVFVATYVLGMQKGTLKKTKDNHRAYSMYLALEYISKVRDCIDNKQLIQAIRHSLKISYYFSREDALLGENLRSRGREGGARSAGRSDDDYEKWAALYKEFYKKDSDKPISWLIKKIVKTLQEELSSKPKEESSVPCVSTVEKALRKKLGIQKVRKSGLPSEI
jgi:hypothetical protein